MSSGDRRVEGVHHRLERGLGIRVRDVLGDDEAVPPQRGRRDVAAADGRRAGEDGIGRDVRSRTLRVDHRAGVGAPAIHHRDLAAEIGRLHGVGVVAQIVRRHVGGERLHHLEGGEALVVVDGELGRARGEEVAAFAQIHVHELGAEIPAGLVGSGERVIHDALVLDRLGGGEDVFIGLGRLHAGFLQHVLAVEQVLRVGVERDGDGLAVDLDQLVGLQHLAVLGDEVVERADEVGREQRRDRVVGDERHGVLRRIDRQRRDLKVLVLGGLVGGHLDGIAGAFLGARRRARAALRSRWRGWRRCPS